MARLLWILWAIGLGVGLVAGVRAQGDIDLGSKKANVLVEVQQIPLESFGTPADVPDRVRWSTWLIRLTNRRKTYPIMVQGNWGQPGFPPPIAGPPNLPTAHSLSWGNWILLDGEGKQVGKAAHRIQTGVNRSNRPTYTPALDYLLQGKTPLAAPEYALQAPPEVMPEAKAFWLKKLFADGPGVADTWLRQYRSQLPEEPIVPPTKPSRSPALWPGKTTWGYLIFYQGIATRSTKLVPRGHFGKGVSWALKVNPGLLDELTDPVE